MPNYKNRQGTGLVETDTLKVGSFSYGSSERLLKVARVPLGVGTSGGGVFSWANPESTSIIITRVIMDDTAASSGAGTVDVGTTATSATTVSDNLIDGLDVNAATGLFDNITNAGTNGKGMQKLAAGKWVTASQKTGSVAGLAGYAYILYFPI